MTNPTTDEVAVDIVDVLKQAINEKFTLDQWPQPASLEERARDEIQSLRVRLTAATQRAEQAERMLAEAVAGLESISASQFGLQNVLDDYGHDTNAYNYQAMKYWSGLAMGKQHFAMAVLTAIRSAASGEQGA